MLKVTAVVLIFLFVAVREGLSIRCYRCTSATPGCTENFHWRGIGIIGDSCPEDNDICVKVIERRGAKQTIIRDCLSALNFRSDMPADKYEGCRPAAPDFRLAHYVNHSIKEHDVTRTYFNDVTFCFCFLDHICNGTVVHHISKAALALFSFFILGMINNLL